MAAKNLPFVKAVFLTAIGLILMLPSAFAQSAMDRLKGGEIRLGVYRDIPPMSSKSGTDFKGFSVDLCMRLVERVARTLTVKPKIKFVEINTQDRFEKITSQSIDIECGATTITQKRQDAYGFTYWTFVTGTNYLERVDAKNATGLNGKSVAVLKNSSNYVALEQHRTMMLLDFKKVSVANPEEGFELLKMGKVDAFALDEILLFSWKKEQKNTTQYQLGPRLMTVEPYGLMLPKSDSAWSVAINTALVELFRDGTFDRTYDLWFGGDSGLRMNPYMREAKRLPSRYGIP